MVKFLKNEVYCNFQVSFWACRRTAFRFQTGLICAVALSAIFPVNKTYGLQPCFSKPRDTAAIAHANRGILAFSITRCFFLIFACWLLVLFHRNEINTEKYERRRNEFNNRKRIFPKIIANIVATTGCR